MFACLESFWFLLQIWVRALLGILGFRFFPFITLNILCHSLLACRVSIEKLADNLMGFPLFVICLCSLVVFNSLSSSLIFVSLITCLGVFLMGFILPGTLCSSWTWLTISFPMFGKFSAIISSNDFSAPLFLSSLPVTPIMWILVHLMLSQRSVNSVQLLSWVQLFATPWTAACQASLSITNCWVMLKVYWAVFISFHSFFYVLLCSIDSYCSPRSLIHSLP